MHSNVKHGAEVERLSKSSAATIAILKPSACQTLRKKRNFLLILTISKIRDIIFM